MNTIIFISSIIIFLIWLFWDYSFLSIIRGKLSNNLQNIKNISEGKISILTANSTIVLTQEHCLDIIKLRSDSPKEFYSYTFEKIKTILARKVWLQGYINECLDKQDFNQVMKYLDITHDRWEYDVITIHLPFNWQITPHKLHIFKLGYIGANYNTTEPNCFNIYDIKTKYKNKRLSLYLESNYFSNVDNTLRIVGYVLDKEIEILKDRHDELWKMLKNSYDDLQDGLIIKEISE
jgi:hypothetical protein